MSVLHLFILVLTVSGFEQSLYVVSEEAGSVMLCASLASQVVQRSATVTFQTTAIPNSAIRTQTLNHFHSVQFDYNIITVAGNDFEETTALLVFGPLFPTRQCANVAVLQNTLLEGTESFSVQLTPLDGDTVVLSPSTATVVITDQDSKLIYYP